MPASVSHITTHLRQLIYYHLDNNLLKNALFLAARLVAYDSRSPESAYLLASCQFQAGYTKAAWDTSKPFALRGTHLGCAYIFAQCCLELGRYVDGIASLEKSKGLWQNRNTWSQHNESRRQHLPDAAAVLCLKGKLWKAHKNMDQAVECWAMSLKLNPFMWDAFLNLCESGAKISVPSIYKMPPELMAAAHPSQSQNQKTENTTNSGMEKVSASNLPLQAQATNHPNQSLVDPFLPSQKVNSNSNHGSSVLWEKLNGSKVSVNTVSTILDEESQNTPSTVVDIDDSLFQAGNPIQEHEPPPAPMRKVRSANEVTVEQPVSRWRGATGRTKMKTKGVSEEAQVLQDPPPPIPPSKRTISGQVASNAATHANGPDFTRRSNRLARPPSATGTTNSKLSNFTTAIGLKEGRDIKKAKAPSTKGRTATTSTVGRVVSGNRTRTGSTDAMDIETKEQRPNVGVSAVHTIPNQKPKSEVSINRDLEALQALLDLFGRMATAQLALTNYDCQNAIQLYNSLAPTQRETPYILAQIGKAYYEQASYAEAEKFFIWAKQIAPCRLEDMEVYSTVLWHLKSEVELAYLAHELIELDRLSPQAWCCIGNSFSLQREHEQALKCFRRSTQLDPQFAYGFTLQGHEYIANEEFQKALDAYRSAIAADGRHYNAWYGLGKVYEKMGKWAIAEQHYRAAARINPTNAVLICCIGVVLEKLKKPEQALQMYTRACSISPTNALSRFKKARCLMNLARTREALAELMMLRDMVPEEPNVWFMLGRLYKMLRQKGEAVRAFTMALNLDPKAAQYIKDALESLDEEDEDGGIDEDEDME